MDAMEAIVTKVPFLPFPHFWTSRSILNLIVLKVILLLSLNNMSVDHLGARGKQTDILSGHYGWNSGPNLVFGHFPFFGHPVVFKNNCFESYSFTTL